MIKHLDISEFGQLWHSLPVLDVRSPSEFQNGHIPGAVNLPLFNDTERALVGRTYTQSGRAASVELGLDLVGNKLSTYVKQARGLAKDGALLIHCWRGGMRSASMAWLMDVAGLNVYVLDGGYKSYRIHIRKRFQVPLPLIVLGGRTGSGKTAILQAIAQTGHQVIDLESLAHHKGSVFGGLGMSAQPTNEQFENDLYHACQKLDIKKTTWIEDESLSIGSVNIPEPLFKQLINSPVFEISMVQSLRVKRLVEEYAQFPPGELALGVTRIEKKLGGDNTRRIINAIHEQRFDQAADLLLSYYDKAYEKSLQKRAAHQKRWYLNLEKDEPVINAQLILEKLFSEPN